MGRTTARDIDEAAAGWVARLDRGLTPAEESELEAWLAADDRRLGAFGRLVALSARTERAAALGPTYRPEQFRPRRSWSTRRELIAGGGAVLGGAAAAGAAVWIGGAGASYATRRGEVRVVPLADGSVVTLNTASRISVRYAKATRAIELLEGEALFDVAKDPGRPFVVAAGALTVRAVGTTFTVRRSGDRAVQVLVSEGLVEITSGAARGARPIRLAANMRATGRSAEAVVARPVLPADVGRALLWREGRIAFEGETLARAATEFARYSDVRIVIDDPGLAREEISGMYAANDPIGFGRAVGRAFGAQVDVDEREVRIHR